MEVSRSVTSHVTRRDDVTTTDIFGNTTTVIGTPFLIAGQPQTLSEQRTNALTAGWAGGLGIEAMLWGGLFARGEWEYAKFLAVKNTVVSANHLRFGIGYKF
jgi:outer membrane immunogenic protein